MHDTRLMQEMAQHVDELAVSFGEDGVMVVGRRPDRELQFDAPEHESAGMAIACRPDPEPRHRAASPIEFDADAFDLRVLTAVRRRQMFRNLNHNPISIGCSQLLMVIAPARPVQGAATGLDVAGVAICRSAA